MAGLVHRQVARGLTGEAPKEAPGHRQPARRQLGAGAGASHYKREQEEKKRQYKFNSH